MNARSWTLCLAALLCSSNLFAADPQLSAGSKIRNEYYSHMTPRRVMRQAPQATAAPAPQVARTEAPAQNQVAQADAAPSRSTRTFSVEPNTQAAPQMMRAPQRTPVRRYGLNLDANRKILGKYWN